MQVEMKELMSWIADNQNDLKSQAPLASTLSGVKKQKKWLTVSAMIYMFT